MFFLKKKINEIKKTYQEVGNYKQNQNSKLISLIQ